MLRPLFLQLCLLFVFPAALSKVFSDTADLLSPFNYDFIIIGGKFPFLSFRFLA